jgi:hypothetical protein
MAPANPLGLPPCDAGRRTSYGGRWPLPCPGVGRHQIGTEGNPAALFLCDEHFDQVNTAGLICEPYQTAQEWTAKYGLRG